MTSTRGSAPGAPMISYSSSMESETLARGIGAS